MVVTQMLLVFVEIHSVNGNELVNKQKHEFLNEYHQIESIKLTIRHLNFCFYNFNSFQMGKISRYLSVWKRILRVRLESCLQAPWKLQKLTVVNFWLEDKSICRFVFTLCSGKLKN